VIPFAALAAAGLLAAAPPASPAFPGEGDLSISADEMTVDTVTGALRLSGNVVIRRGLVTLRAAAADYDRESGEVVASGGVLLADPTRVVAADGVRAVMGDGWQADQVVAFLKDGPSPVGDAVTLEDARRAGSNRASISGAHLTADRSGRLELTDAKVTLCDCGGGAPSWILHARRADVIPGKRVVVSWPVLRVTPRLLGIKKPIPVLTVPWLYLPLSDRQTGLLFPAFGNPGATGFSLGVPVFVTLGRSADLTVTPQYFFGPAASRVAGGDPSVKGPGAELELRWAPAPGANGQLEARWVYDEADEPNGAAGHRLQLGLHHGQPILGAGRLIADLALASDPVWWRDFTSDVLLRTAYYARSSVIASRSFDAAVLEGSVAYHEALAPYGRVAGPVLPGGYGPFSGELPVFQRWPSLALELLPVRLGPLLASGRAGLSRYAPLRGAVSDGGLDGVGPGDRLWQPNAVAKNAPPDSPYVADPGELDGKWTQHERLATTRADARLELRAPIPLARGAVRLEPYLRGAATAYRYDGVVGTTTAPPLDDAAAWAVYGAAASIELERAWGATVHRLIPRVEYRGGTGAAGSAPQLPAFDAWDRVRNEEPLTVGGTTYPARRFLTAAPDGTFQQLRLSIDNRFARPGLAVRLELGQDADLRAGRFGESFVTAQVGSGLLALNGTARFLLLQSREDAAPRPAHPSWLDGLTELRAGFQLKDPRGDQLHAALLSVGPGGSGTAVVGVDPLFDLRPVSVDAVAQGSAGARAVLGGATVGYDALVPVRSVEVARCGDTNQTRPSAPLEVQQHTFSFAWDSPCHCFALRAVLRMNGCGEISSYSVVFDLAKVGERAAVR
jgi:LPS-assembly protein